MRSRYVQLDADFDPACVNELFAEMRAEAEAVVKAGAPDAELIETRTADMRYRGQGHEITVEPAARRRSTPPRARSWSKLYEERLRRDLRPDDPGPRRRDHELDAAARRRAAAELPKAPPQPADKPAKARVEPRRSTIRPIRT